MAELLNLDEHCAFASCGRLDFLPVPCLHCALRFCAQHSSAQAHSCAKAPTNTVSAEEIKHLKNVDVYKCTFGDCSKTELAPILCSKCDMQVGFDTILSLREEIKT